MIRTSTLSIAISVFVFAAAARSDQRQPTVAEPGDDDAARYELVWSDEFEVDGPPRAENWRHERGFVRNEELQWYQPENARCEDGLLIIEGRRERVANPRYKPRRGDGPDNRDWRRRRQWAEYTSACLTTRGLHQWRYGRLEMRARIDVRPGLWPAFWTLGTARRWPACGEVDIMEYYRGRLLANAAWLGQKRATAWDSATRPIAELGDPDWPTEFHVWRMDWNEKSIRLLVDDVLLNEIDLDETVNHDTERTNPFREPHYILLNLAMGGTQGGDPSATEFPARFEIDYVRVYQPDSAQHVPGP